MRPLTLLKLLFLLLLVNIAVAQQQNHFGKDFWVVFNHNYDFNPGATASLMLKITAGDNNVQGRVTIQGLSFQEDFYLGSANDVVLVEIPTETMCDQTGLSDKGIQVTADKDISVLALNKSSFSSDAFQVIPSAYHGIVYRVMTYEATAEGENYAAHFTVVSPFDNNQISIVPSQNTLSGQEAGIPFSITLNKGETYTVKSNGTIGGDLTGSLVQSATAFAVFSGVSSVNVPAGIGFKDHIASQMPPVIAWGTEYITNPLSARSNGDRWRLLASEDGTVININGADYPVLNAGEFMEQVLTAASVITSGKPILAMQFSHSKNWDNLAGDPFMMYVPPVDQHLNSYTFATPNEGFSQNFVNAVVTSAAVAQMQLNGIPVAGSFQVIPGSTLSRASFPVDINSVNIIENTSGVPFGISVYGFSDADSYGFTGGSGNEFNNTDKAVNLQTFNVGKTSMDITWTRGSGDNVAVFMFRGTSEFALPQNGVSYSASNVFAQGSEIGNSRWYCVYNGTGTGVTVTGLTHNSNYRIMAIEYSGGPAAENYILGADLNNPVNIQTPDNAPTHLTYAPGFVDAIIETTVVNAVPNVSGGAVNSYQIAPTLPAGIGFNTTTGAIYGTPFELLDETTFTITAENSGGQTTGQFTLQVRNIAPSDLIYTPDSIRAFVDYTNIVATPEVTGVVDEFAIEPDLPEGMNLDATTGIISGIPSELLEPSLFTITAANNGGTTSAVFRLWVKEFEPLVDGFSDIEYIERRMPVHLAPDVSFFEGFSYINGFLKLEIEESTPTENLSFAQVAEPTVEGAVSVDGYDVFTGIGNNDKVIIGRIDAEENGWNGKPLTVNLAYERSFLNPGFENGLDGWTTQNGIYSQQETLDGIEIPIREEDQCNGHTHGLIRIFDNPQDLITDVSVATDEGAAEGESYIVLQSSGKVPEVFGADCRGDAWSFFGPVLTSDPFLANNGDVFSFNWKAASEEDLYDMFAFLLTAGNDKIWNTEDDERILIASERGSTIDWQLNSVTIPQTGEYRFEFVAGAYDLTGGGVVGVTMMVDNIMIAGNITSIGDDLVQKLARLVTYENTSCFPEENRQVTLSVRNKMGNENTASTQIDILKVNCAPEVTSMPNDLYYHTNRNTEDFGYLFDDTKTGFLEDGQKITEFILKIENILFNNQESLTVDGHTFPVLNNQTGETDLHNITYNVAIASRIATITFSSSTGLAADAFHEVIDNIQYQRALIQPDTTIRRVKLHSLKDNGGTNLGGIDQNIIPDIVSTVYFSTEVISLIMVVDEFGEPLPGVEISSGDLIFQTNGNGQVFPNLADGEHELWFSADGYADQPALFTIVEETGMLLVQMGRYYPVVISVLDHNDMPLEGASVLITNESETVSEEHVTDENGQISAMLLNDSYSFAVEATGFLTDQSGFTVDGAAQQASISMRPILPLTFTLMDQTGNFVEGATISIFIFEEITSAEGTVIFELPEGDYAYEITATGFLDASGEISMLGQPEELIVQLTPVYNVVFSFFDESETPLQGVQIQIDGHEWISDENGMVAMNLPAAWHSALITASGYEGIAYDFMLTPAGFETSLYLERNYDVNIFVVNAFQQPVSGAWVHINGNLLITDLSGQISTKLPNGRHDVVVEAESYQNHQNNLVINGIDLDVNIELTSISFDILVTTVNGDPLPDVELIVGGSFYATNEQGLATLILPNGNHSLLASANGFKTYESTFIVENYIAEVSFAMEKVIKSFPWEEGFENEVFPPAGWKVSSLAEPETEWSVSETENHTSEGLKSAWHKYGTTQTQLDGWLISPAIEVPQQGNFDLSFYSFNKWTEFYHSNSIWIATGADYPDTEDFTLLWSAPHVFNQWVKNCVSLQDYAGQTIYLAFRYEGAFAHSWFLDDISIGPHVGSFSLNLLVDPQFSGLVTGAGDYLPGTTVSLSAKPNLGFGFVHWASEAGTILSIQPDWEYTTTDQHTNVVAHFDAIQIAPQTFSLSLEAAPDGAATLTGAGLYEEAQQVNLLAVPEEGYAFVSWTDANGVLISTKEDYDYTMPARNVLLKANFENVTSVSESNLSEFTIYPNPAKGKFFIKSKFAINRVTFIDLAGKTVLEHLSPGQTNYTIDVSGLTPGLYILHMASDTAYHTARIQIIR